MKVRLETGHLYLAGASVPWWVPRGTVVAGATSFGFRDVVVADKGEIALPQDPPTDDYNTVGHGVWSKETADVDLPDAVRWVIDATPAPSGTVPSDTVEPSPVRPLVILGGGLALLAAGLGTVWLTSR